MKFPIRSCLLILHLAAALIGSGCRPAAPQSYRVVTTECCRRLLIDGRLAAYADTATWESRLKYAAVLTLPMRFFRTPGTVLVIGAGTGSIARSYANRSWKVVSVEPDSGLAGVARRSFGLSENPGGYVQQDGRAFLDRDRGRYNLIIEDLVGRRSPDPHMATAEFFSSVRSHLEPGGMVAISLECAGWHDRIVESLGATLRREFPHVIILPIVEPPNRFGSIVLIASPDSIGDPLTDLERNQEYDPEWRFGPGYQETHAWDNRFEASERGGAVQTDATNTLAEAFRTIDDSARAQGSDYLP